MSMALKKSSVLEILNSCVFNDHKMSHELQKGEQNESDEDGEI